MTRARSLSRLANTNALTVDASQNVGIGSTIPDVRLDVNGNMNVSGTLTYEDVTNVDTAGITTTGGLVVTGLGATIGGITTFFGDLNFGAAGVGGTVTPLGHAEFAGVVTATSFSGNGAGLTGVASTDNINTSTLAQFTGGVGIADSIFHIGDSNNAIRFPAADTFTVETSGSERLRIDSSGRLLVTGGNASLNVSSFEPHIQVAGTTAEASSIMTGRFGNNESAPFFIFHKSRNASINGNTVVADDDILGRIAFYGADGTDYEEAAHIQCQVDGTPNDDATDMPGRLLFATTADGDHNATERLRIDSSGRVLIGTTNAVAFGSRQVLAVANGTTGAVLSLYNSTTAANNPRISSNPGGSEINDIGIHAASTNGNIIAYTNNDTERLRIDSSGRLLVGATVEGAPAADNLTLEDSGSCGLTIRAGTSDYSTIYLSDATSGTGEYAGSIQYGHADNSFRIGANSVERLRIASAGQIGLSGANYGTSGQVLTSNGSGSAVTWEDASGGAGITTQAGTASGIVTSMFLNDATDHKVTATGICTITTTQSGTEGQSHTIRIVNSGSATVGFSTYFLFPSGAAPSLPTASGAVSLISFTVHDSVGAGCTQLLAGASVNFS